MSIHGRFQSTDHIQRHGYSIWSLATNNHKHANIVVPLVLSAVFLLTGCVSDKMDEKNVLVSYQQLLAERSYQQRVNIDGKDPNKPLGLLRQVPSKAGNIPDVEIITDPNTGQQNATLTIEQVLARTLANSPEIRVVSFDPSIAKQDITRAAAEFDVTAFGDLNFENEDNPPNSIYQSGQSDELLRPA
jgi:hypothetical protein